MAKFGGFPGGMGNMQNMIKSQHFGTIGENIIDFVAYEYEQSGDLSFFIDYCIVCHCTFAESNTVRQE